MHVNTDPNLIPEQNKQNLLFFSFLFFYAIRSYCHPNIQIKDVKLKCYTCREEGKQSSWKTEILACFPTAFLSFVLRSILKENSQRKETDLSTKFKKAVEKHAQILHFYTKKSDGEERNGMMEYYSIPHKVDEVFK